jgi:hypothetical protein
MSVDLFECSFQHVLTKNSSLEKEQRCSKIKNKRGIADYDLEEVHGAGYSWLETELLTEILSSWGGTFD